MENDEKKLQDRIPSTLVDEALLNNLKHTHEIVDRPEKFAEMFCGVADTQVKVRQKLIEILRLSIASDVEARNEIKDVLKDIYEEDWRKFIRSTAGKLGLVIWTIISAIIGILIKKFIG